MPREDAISKAYEELGIDTKQLGPYDGPERFAVRLMEKFQPQDTLDVTYSSKSEDDREEKDDA